MIWVGTYKDMKAFVSLKQGNKTFIEFPSESKELSKDLPPKEFIMVFKTDKHTSTEKIYNEIIPKILLNQCEFREIFSLSQYDIRYEDGAYLIVTENKIPAKFTIKKTFFFNVIYFHGYYDVYESIHKGG